MKRKLLLTLLTVSCSVVSAVGLAACGPNKHEHSYSDDWSSDSANHWHDCSGCDDKGSEGKHTFGAPQVVTPATCYSAGEQKLTCTVCGYSKTETIATTAHKWSTAWSSDDGHHYHVCVNDGCTATTDTAEHSTWVDGAVIKEPTCTEEGTQKITCGVCDYESTKTLPVKEHSGTNFKVTKPATCLEEGVETGTCDDCGAEVTRPIPMTDHTYGKWTQVTAPDCETPGLEKHTCSVCNHDETREIKPLGHAYGNWENVTPATCAMSGKDQRTCTRCGNVDERVVEANGHLYGEWQIEYPTVNETGSAVKVCSKDPAHTVTVTLPKLSPDQAGYVYNESTGTYTCTVRHELGDIKFTTYTVNSVSDAVAVALKNQNLVIKSHIDRNNVIVDKDGAHTSKVDIDFELGHNYAHISDGSENLNRYISLNDDGTLFPVLVRHIGTESNILVEKDVEATKDSLNGYGFGFTFMTQGEQYYGSGSIISYLYGVGKQNLNKDFVENVTTKNGKPVYSFSYGYVYRLPAVSYFDVVSVEFTLNDSFIVDAATLNVKSYANVETAANARISLQDDRLTIDDDRHYCYDGKVLITGADQIVNDDGTATHEYTYPVPNEAEGYIEASMYIDTDGTPRQRVSLSGVFTFLEDGTCRINAGQEGAWRNSETYIISQISQLPAGEQLPTNPYKFEDFVINSFTLYMGRVVESPAEDGGITTTIEPTDEVVTDGSDLTMSATSNLIFVIGDILPETYNPYFDEFKVSLVDELGVEVEATPIAEVADGEIGYHFSKGNDGEGMTGNYNINIMSRVAGAWTLKIKTLNKTFTANLVVNPIAPSPIYAETYQVNDYTGDSTWSRSVTTASVYQGQEVTFRAAVDHPAYESSRYVATARNAAGEDVTATCLKTAAVDGIPQTTFASDTVGIYTVTIASALSSVVTTTLTVTVKPAPDVTEMLTGDFENANKGYAVKLIPTEEGALAGKAIIVKGFDYVENDFNLDNNVLTSGVERTVIDYSYDADTKEFTCEYVSGAEGKDHGGTLIHYNYGFELSKAYKLFLTYDSEFESGVRERVIIGGFDNALDFKDKIVSAKTYEDTEKLVANVSGKYRITSTDQYTFIVVNGDEANRKAFTSLELELYIGDYIQVWNGISASTVRLSIEVIETYKTVKVEGVALDSDSASVKAESTLALVPVFTPANTTQKGLVWTSSNPAIATVDEHGVVTGVAAGTATITVTTSNGRFFDTIEITVKAANSLEIGDNVLSFSGNSWNYEYVFTGEAGKTYIFNAVHSYAPGGSGNFACGGMTYSYNGGKVSFKATADSEGIIKIVSNQYAYGNYTVTLSITELINVTSVTLDKTEATIDGVGSITLTATVNPDNAANKDGVWSSSDTSVATVDSNGVVTSVGVGTAIITFTSTDNPEAKASCTVTVNDVPPTSVTLDKSEHTLTMGTNDNVTLVVTLAPENTLATSLTWTSSNLNVATVNDKGVVTAVGAGTAVIKVASANGMEASCTITVVKIDATGVTLDKTTADMYIGRTLTLTATVAPENASVKTGKWTSSDETKATVNANGVVTAIAEGEVTITFTSDDDDSVTASCTITITEFILQLGNNSGLEVERQSYNYYKFKGEANTKYVFTNSMRFTMYAVNADGTYDSTVRSTLVDGTATLFLTTDGEGVVNVCVYATRAANVTVTVSKTVPVESVAIDLSAVEVYVGGTVNLSSYVTFTPSTASDKTFTLTSSDPAIATVSGTSVTAVAGGTVTITVTSTDGAKTATAQLTVKERTLIVGDNTVPVTYYVDMLYTLSGAQPNTTYVFTNTVQSQHSVRLYDGNRENVQRTGTIELTTDANGKVSLIIVGTSANDPDDYTVTMNVAPKDAPEPEPITETLTTDGLTVDLNTLGGTLLLDGESFVLGNYYTVYTSYSDDVTLRAGTAEPGNPVTFQYTPATSSISIECAAAHTGVAITVEEHGDTDPNAPVEFESLELGVAKSFTAGFDYVYFQYEVTEAGNYTLTFGDCAESDAFTVVTVGFNDEKKTPDPNNGTVDLNDGSYTLSVGTVYICIASDKMDDNFNAVTISGTVTIAKIASETPDPGTDPDTPTPPSNYTIYDLLNEGSNTIAGMSAYGQAIRSFKGEAGVTYTLTSAMSNGSRATMVKYDNVKKDTDSSVSGATINLTADQYGYIHFRVTAFAVGDAVITIAKAEA